MPIDIGAKMDYKDIISTYLKEKSNEEAVIAVLKEQKKLLANPKKDSILLDDGYFPLIIKLARNSTGKIKYHSIIILSNVEFCTKAKNFYELCKIAAENSNDQEWNARQASFILIKTLNALMMIFPLIRKSQNISKAEINLFYESFKDLFHRLYFSLHIRSDRGIRKSILKSLEIILPKFYDMAKFWNDQADIILVNKVKDEINRGF